MNFLYLIFIIIFFIACENESGKIRRNFDEIFGEEWDKKESEENIKENCGESINQMQNDQNITPKEEQNDQQKRETIGKFEAIKEKLKQKRKYQRKYNNKIEMKIAKLIGASRHKIYKWKKELNLNKNKIMEKSFYDEKKSEFIERIDEFKSLYSQGKQKEFVKELGISYDTFWKWKKEIVPTKYYKEQNNFSDEDKLKKMKQYFKIKEINPKISDENIAVKLEIGSRTLRTWKKKFASIFN